MDAAGLVREGASQDPHEWTNLAFGRREAEQGGEGSSRNSYRWTRLGCGHGEALEPFPILGSLGELHSLEQIADRGQVESHGYPLTTFEGCDHAGVEAYRA